MTSNLNAPVWMRKSPSDNFRAAVGSGERAILLYGPPRTGKTRSIDELIPRSSPERRTIQIHDGWGYDNLVEGFSPVHGDEWRWKSGPLKEAVDSGKKYIVLEEINRTEISQALGEVFSLIESSYRGEENAITLRSGNNFSIPPDVTFIMTMNTIDKSTVEIDDALLGRVAAIEFPPRGEDLNDMLTLKGVSAAFREKILNFYAGALELYPLGHGYFAGVRDSFTGKDFLDYYLARIRPVIWNSLGMLRKQDLERLDELADSLFSPDLL